MSQKSKAKDSLEGALAKRAKKSDDARIFLQSYHSVKQYLKDNYYPWIQASCPFYTDHGENHIKAVTNSASLLVQNSLSELTDLDIYLILSGILWHDVGNVYGRDGHAKQVFPMTEKVIEIGFPDISLQRYVSEIANAHGGKSGLSGTRKKELYNTRNKNYTIDCVALAAIVRFADEISENHTRISPGLLPTIPSENRVYWEYANSIISSVPQPERERVVVDVALDVRKAVTPFPCEELKESRGGCETITLIEYLICRLEKLNNERAYCTREFRNYAYIREVEVRFSLLLDNRRINEFELTAHFGDGSLLNNDSYPDIKIVDEFFRAHEDWTPESLRRIITDE